MVKDDGKKQNIEPKELEKMTACISERSKEQLFKKILAWLLITQWVTIWLC